MQDTSQSAERLKTKEIRKHEIILKFGWRHNLVPNVPSRNQTLSKAVKIHAKVDIKLFSSFSNSLDFFILFQMFCLGLSEQNFCS